MAEMTRAEHQTLIDRRYAEIFDEAYSSTVDQLPMWFDMQTSDSFEERRGSEGELPRWTAFGGALSYTQFYEQYNAVATHIEFTQAYRMARSLVDDDLTGIMSTDRYRKMVDAAVRTRQAHGARLWNFMTSNDVFFYSRSEAVPIASDSHTTRTPNVSTATGFDNLSTAELSQTSFRSLRQQMRRFAGDQGDIANVIPTTLIVPIELEQRGQEVLLSPGDPDNARRSMNPEQNSADIMVPLYMTDANNWGLVNKNMMKENCKWFDYRKYTKPDFRSILDFETYQLKCSGYMRYSFMVFGWRWVGWANVT